MRGKTLPLRMSPKQKRSTTLRTHTCSVKVHCSVCALRCVTQVHLSERVREWENERVRAAEGTPRETQSPEQAIDVRMADVQSDQQPRFERVAHQAALQVVSTTHPTMPDTPKEVVKAPVSPHMWDPFRMTKQFSAFLRSRPMEVNDESLRLAASFPYEPKHWPTLLTGWTWTNFIRGHPYQLIRITFSLCHRLHIHRYPYQLPLSLSVSLHRQLYLHLHLQLRVSLN